MGKENLEHTPGPWIIEKNYTTFDGTELLLLGADNDTIICGFRGGVVNADRRLIAAAPEMADDMIEFIEKVESYQKQNWIVDMEYFKVKFKATIEKATGKKIEDIL